MNQRRKPDASAPDELNPLQRAGVAASLAELLDALVHGWCLTAVVPLALARVEREPLVRARHFEGDLMRGLMEVPGAFWGRYPRLYDRYRQALRASATLRRRLPAEERMRFWSPLSVEQGTTPSPPRDG